MRALPGPGDASAARSARRTPKCQDAKTLTLVAKLLSFDPAEITRTALLRYAEVIERDLGMDLTDMLGAGHGGLGDYSTGTEPHTLWPFMYSPVRASTAMTIIAGARTLRVWRVPLDNRSHGR